jgi:methylated-DNA-[protein]-cysteine S-methyltransferase
MAQSQEKSMMTTFPTAYTSPLGTLVLSGETFEPEDIFVLTSVSMPKSDETLSSAYDCYFRHASPLFKPVIEQLDAYFAGELKKFTVEFDAVGTLFQRHVWRALDDIPYGSTTTYQRVAEDLGEPAAVRAVANAIGRNPLLIVRPCHRVIRSDRKIGGYAGGTANKDTLLRLEGAM